MAERVAARSAILVDIGIASEFYGVRWSLLYFDPIAGMDLLCRSGDKRGRGLFLYVQNHHFSDHFSHVGGTVVFRFRGCNYTAACPFARFPCRLD